MGSGYEPRTSPVAVTRCRDLTAASGLPKSQATPAGAAAGDGPRRLGALVGAVLVMAGVAGLHYLHRGENDAMGWVMWSGVLLAWLSAIGAGVKLAMWGLRPVIGAAFEAAKERLSEPVQAVAASGAVIAGALGMWSAFRGGYTAWWQRISGESDWTLLLGVGQMLVAVLSGAALFTGSRYLTGLAKAVLTDAGMLGIRDRTTAAEGVGAHRRGAEDSRDNGDEKLWHPGLLAALIAGGAGLVLLAAGIAPKLYVWITGPDVLSAVAAIAFVMAWGIGSNLGWWKGLGGLYTWTTGAAHKTGAVAP